MSDDERRDALIARWKELAPDEVDFDLEYSGYIPAFALWNALTCAARRGWHPTIDHGGEDWCALIGQDEATEASPDLAVLSAYVMALEASDLSPA